MMYASWRAEIGVASGAGDNAAIWGALISRSTVLHMPGFRPAGFQRCEISTGAWASRRMPATRSAGHAGSRGRYAPPAFMTASAAVTNAVDRSTYRPTG